MALTKVTGDFIETGSITQGHLHSSHGITLDHIGDGSTNTFFTTANARAAISATGSLSYNNSTGVMSFTMPTLNTTNITEGNKLFFTDARAISALTAGTNIAIASNGTISSTDTNTTYSVGDGGLTQNNFTNTLKGKLDGIATGATNITNNNQLTNGAGYLTSLGANSVDSDNYVDGSIDTAHLADSTSSTTGVTYAKMQKVSIMNRILGRVSPSDLTVAQLTKSDVLTMLNVADGANNYSLPFTNNSSNWNTAYGWGNHASGGYLTSHQSLSGYLPLSGGTMTGQLAGYVNASGDGQSNLPFKLSADYNSYMVAAASNTWGLFWAGNSGARYGTNGLGGPGNIWSNSTNPNEMCFVHGDSTTWSVHTDGNTWQSGTITTSGGTINGSFTINGLPRSYVAQNSWGYLTSTSGTGNESGIWFTGTTARLLLRDSSGAIRSSISANGTAADNIINGNAIIHAGNYSSYALPVSGGTLTGNLALRYSTSNSDDYSAFQFAAGSADYIIKASSTRGVFGRSSFGWHIAAASAFGVYSSGWVKCFGVEGGTGNTFATGTFSAGGDITTSGSSSSTAVYHTEWVRNHSNNNGHYWSNTGWHIYPESTASFYMRSGSTGEVRLNLLTAGTSRGSVYANSSNDVGFLNNYGTWRLRVTGGDYTEVLGSKLKLNDTSAYIHGGTITSRQGSRFIDVGYSGSCYIEANRTDSASSTILFGAAYNTTGIWSRVGTTNGGASHSSSPRQFTITMGSTVEFTMATNGVMSGDFNDTSDVLFKKNIANHSYGLAAVNTLKPREFNWKRNTRPQGKQVGFIAQEVEEIIPEVVHGYDGAKSINGTGLISVLTKAIQELSQQVTDLKAEVELLKQ